MRPDPNDEEPVTEMDVSIDTSLLAEPTITAIASSGNIVVSRVESELPADTEPSTLEPTVGVRGLGAVSDGDTIPDDEDESTTLNAESRLLKAHRVRSPAPLPAPVSSHRPSTSTEPKKRVSKSPTIKGLGSFLSPMLTPSEPFRVSSPDLAQPRSKSPASIDREMQPSEPTLEDHRNDATVERPAPASQKACAATEERDEEEEEEDTETNADEVIAASAAAAEKEDETAVDTSLLSGGVSLTAAAEAAASIEEDDDAPTSIRHEASVVLADSDLVTDPGSVEDHEKSARAAMGLMQTEPASFPVQKRVLVGPPAAASPMSPSGAASVKLVGTTTGATPITHGDLPAQRKPMAPQGPTFVVRRKRRSWIGYVLVPAAIVIMGTAAFVQREPIKSALFDRAPPPSAATSIPASLAANGVPSSAPAIDSAEVAAAATASASAAASADPAKPRASASPPRKPPPPPPPPARPATKPGQPAPRSSTPLHI